MISKSSQSSRTIFVLDIFIFQFSKTSRMTMHFRYLIFVLDIFSKSCLSESKIRFAEFENALKMFR